jgi:pimeloyl-ACP methyl ester carboxylesterase
VTPSDLKVEHHFVELPGLRLHYVEAGEGPTVMLLHGFPENWWSWRHQVPALAAAGFRVIAPDLRGYGETAKNGPYDLDTVVNDVCNLVVALGGEKRVRVVGHDWGGAAAWHLASKRPEFCDRLAVLNCPHPVLMRERLLTRPSWSQLKKSWYMFFFQLPWLPEYVLTRDGGAEVVKQLRGNALDRRNFGEDELKPFRDAVQRPGAANAMVGWYRSAIRQGLLSPFSTPRYPAITVDTLLIWGKDDSALGFDDVVPGTERYVRHLDIRPIENCGHFVQSEKPDEVNRLLVEFLKK